MPRANPIQHAFNHGEWSPIVLGRTDLPEYQAAAAKVTNWYITPQGGLLRRSGSRFVAHPKSLTQRGRLEPFVFSNEQAYVLLWGDRYLWIFRDEGLLRLQTLTGLRASYDVSSVSDEFELRGHGYRDGDGPVRFSTTATLPAPLNAVDNYFVRIAQSVSVLPAAVDTVNDELVVAAGHGYSDRMGPFWIDSSIALPAGLVRERDYYIVYVSAVRFGLSLAPGGAKVNITSTGSGQHDLTPTDLYRRSKFRVAATAAGPAIDLTTPGTGLHTMTPVALAAPIEVATPYLEADLDGLDFAQSTDVLYVFHARYPTQKLTRISAQGFGLEPVDWKDGPYLPENTTATTLQPSATTGQNITITASVALFVGGDVGRLVRIKTAATFWGYAKIVAVNPVSFTDADIESHLFDPADVNTGTDEVTVTGHGMDTGELVRLVAGSGALPAPLLAATDYFVRAVSADLLAFFPTAGDAVGNTNRINLTTAGTGLGHRVTSSVIDLVLHGWTGGEGALQLTNAGGALPAGLLPSTDYFVVFVDANAIALSLSRGGATVGIDSPTGGGTHSLHGDAAPLVSCTADVKAPFASTAASAAWRLGSFAPRTDAGFPRTGSFHEQRLWVASNPGDPDTAYGSKSADFEAMSPTGDLTATAADLDDTVDDDNAVVLTFGDDQVNALHWLKSAKKGLLTGTETDVHAIRAASLQEAITPTNVDAPIATEVGTSRLRPVNVKETVLAPSRTGRQLNALQYTFESESYDAEDLTRLAEHITGSGIVDIAYAKEPWSLVLCPIVEGTIATLTFVRSQEVAAWSPWTLGGAFVDYSFFFAGPAIDFDASAIRLVFGQPHGLDPQIAHRVRFLFVTGSLPPIVPHRDYWLSVLDENFVQVHASEAEARFRENPIALEDAGAFSCEAGIAVPGIVESIAVIPAPAGDPSATGIANVGHDQVWLFVRRTVGGLVQRSIEFVEGRFERQHRVEDGYFVDCGLTRASGSAVTTVSGLMHLALETVDAVVDGRDYLDLVVAADGSLTLPAGSPAGVKWHVGYALVAELETLRQALASQEGTAETTLGRVDHLVLRLDRSRGGELASVDRRHFDDLDRYLIDASAALDTPPPLFSGDVEVPFEGAWETGNRFVLRQRRPLPFSLLAVISKLQKGARGDRSD